MNVIGDVRGRDVLIVDDIGSTAGTLVNTVEALRAGARRIIRRHPRHLSGRRSNVSALRHEALLVAAHRTDRG